MSNSNQLGELFSYVLLSVMLTLIFAAAIHPAIGFFIGMITLFLTWGSEKIL